MVLIPATKRWSVGVGDDPDYADETGTGELTKRVRHSSTSAPSVHCEKLSAVLSGIGQPNPLRCHSRPGGNPETPVCALAWIPAFAAMTA